MQAQRHAIFALLGGSTVRSGSGLGPLGMRPKYVSARRAHPLGVHIAHDDAHQVARLVILLEEGFGVRPRDLFEIAHVADHRLAVRVRLERRVHGLLNQRSDRLALRAHAALFHHHVLLLIELAHDGLQEFFRFQEEPQLGGVRRQAEGVACPVLRRAGVQVAAAGALDGVAVFVLDHEFARAFLRRLESGFQVLELLRVRLRTLTPLVAQRQESLVHAVQRVALFLVVAAAQRGRALERHVLEDVRQARDALDLLHAAHIGVSEKARHRRLMALHHDERHAVLQREAADARLDFLKAAGGGQRACHYAN